ncbi:MAG: hypothetical protein RIE59_14220 [Imperialibacter sp.]
MEQQTVDKDHEKDRKFVSGDFEKIKQRALTKAITYLDTGKSNTFYSFDTDKYFASKNIWKGFNGLKNRLIEGKSKDQYKSAQIYINQPDNKGPLIAQWIDGKRTI